MPAAKCLCSPLTPHPSPARSPSLSSAATLAATWFPSPQPANLILCPLCRMKTSILLSPQALLPPSRDRCHHTPHPTGLVHLTGLQSAQGLSLDSCLLRASSLLPFPQPRELYKSCSPHFKIHFVQDAFPDPNKARPLQNFPITLTVFLILVCTYTWICEFG